jgi:hypothetical protein
MASRDVRLELKLIKDWCLCTHAPGCKSLDFIEFKYELKSESVTIDVTPTHIEWNAKDNGFSVVCNDNKVERCIPWKEFSQLNCWMMIGIDECQDYMTRHSKKYALRNADSKPEAGPRVAKWPKDFTDEEKLRFIGFFATAIEDIVHLCRKDMR